MLEICPSCKELFDHSRLYGDLCEPCEQELGEQDDARLETEMDRLSGELE